MLQSLAHQALVSVRGQGKSDEIQKDERQDWHIDDANPSKRRLGRLYEIAQGKEPNDSREQYPESDEFWQVEDIVVLGCEQAGHHGTPADENRDSSLPKPA
jgi:hypothetical protein